MSDLLDRLGSALQDRYRLVRELGRGGMAVVCLAEDLKHKRSVAIKVMRPEIARGLGSERFLREIEIAARLAHPSILPLHDSGEAEGLLYFVMPYLEGATLRDRLDRYGALPLEEAIRIASEVGDALDYAHGLGLVHRDVKPENILFQAGHAVVSDFGIAKAVSEAGTSALTETGHAIGTLKYMSPEQAAGETDVDTRSDVYSLGCVLYEMLSGEAPFVGSSDRALLARKVTQPPPPLGSTRGAVPATVRETVRRALASDPADRYARPGELARALREAVTAEAIAGHTRRAKRARTVRAVAMTAALALLGAGGWWATSLVGEAGIELVAVLPLVNASGDPDQEFFVSGLHTELIQELSRADIRVISPTSVIQYRDNDRPASEVARELGVDAVIEGSTSLVGGSVSLDLRLTDGGTDELIWFESFESGLGDILTLYADATRAIAGRIGVDLRPEVDAALASAPEVSPEVYRALLQARFHRLQLSEAGMSTALDYYDFVLEQDPDNAEALAGIAGAWGARAQNGYVSAEEALARGEPALRRAIAIDSTLAEVQETLAGRRTWGAWDWDAGERSFRQTLAADPTMSTARAYYSQLLHYLGRDEEAAAEIERAVREDPFNPQIRTLQAMDLNFLHRYEEAEAVLGDVLSRSPGYGMALTTLRTTHHLLGRHEEALEMWRASNARDPEALAALDRGYAADGYEGALRSLAEMLIARSDTAHVTPWQIGTLYTRAGDGELALDYLERAFEEHDPNIPYLSVDPIFDYLRNEPRFQAMIRRLGLPQ